MSALRRPPRQPCGRGAGPPQTRAPYARAESGLTEHLAERGQRVGERSVVGCLAGGMRARGEDEFEAAAAQREQDDAADVPQDCDGAIGYLQDLMDQYDTMTDMPIAQLSNIGTVTGVITTTCSVNQMSEFLNDPDVSAWLSGT